MSVRLFQVIRSEQEYRKLLLANLLSGIGDWFNSVALFSLLLHLTGSGFAVGMTLTLRTLPYMIMGPLGGFLADRFNRKTLFVVSDFVRAGLALSFLYIHSTQELWIAYFGTFCLTSFSALSTPAKTAILPQIVKQEHIVVANSLEQSNSGLVMALGSAIGGVATAALGSNLAFGINSLSFLLSGLLCLSIRYKRKPAIQQAIWKEQTILQTPSTAALAPKNTQANDGLKSFLRNSRTVKSLILFSVLWPIGGGFINVLLSVYGYQTFHSGNVGVGILYGALGVGFLCSGFVAHRFSSKLKLATLIGFVLEGVSHACMSQAWNLPIAAMFLVIATIGGGIGNASIDTLTMEMVPKQYHGRIFAMYSTISSIGMSICMIAASYVLSYISARTLGLLAGLSIVVASGLSCLGLFEKASLYRKKGVDFIP